MRYLVTARVRPGREAALLRAIEEGTLGRGSVAGGEYAGDMARARRTGDGAARWVEVCFCDVPLDEEPWACCDCDCSARLEERMESWGRPFLEVLRAEVEGAPATSG
ncbi:MAG TPA: hypothetical protein VIH93_16850 [Thermoanaerobaculia bacterium]